MHSFFSGINEPDFFNTILIYPNPSSEILLLNYKLSDDGTCTIYNLLGEKEAELILERTNNSKIISLNNIANGLYFLVIKNEKGELFNMKLTVLK